MTTLLVSPPKQLAELFNRLRQQWKDETQFISSTNVIAMHPEYQRIIGLGPQVLPLIFTELQREPDHWFWALRALTGEDPVDMSHIGDIAAMQRDWIDWAHDNGWLS